MSLLRNRKVVNTLLQLGFVGVLLAILLSAILIGKQNMDAQGLTGSFGFLEQATGWRINFSLIEYQITSSYARALSVGAINTIFLGVITLIFGTIVGLLAGTARLSSNKLVARLGGLYVEIFRNIPLVLQALFWYSVLTHLPRAKQAISPFEGVYLSNRGAYFPWINVETGSVFLALLVITFAMIGCIWTSSSRKTARWAKGKRRSYILAIASTALLIVTLILTQGRIADSALWTFPELKGLNFRGGIRLSPELGAAIIAISLFGGGYLAEIFRAGLMSVRKGMDEAGAALGLRPYQVFWRIKLPLAFRSILPTLTNQYVWLMKATTIGIAIGFNDFFMVVAISINQSGQTINLIMLLIIGFWILNFSLAALFNWINRSIAIKGTQNR